MNLDKTEEIIERHFPNQQVEKYDKGVFRCTKEYHDEPYEILYIDCNKTWTKEEFDLEEYQEKYLLNDFYRTNNYLQWNYYFIFLGNQDEIKKNRSRKEMIERDQIYSRKFVMSVEDFDLWLDKIEDITTSQVTDIQQDLSTQWINFLRDADLDCVYLKDENYTDGVERYLKGEPIKENNSQSDISSDSSVERIHEVKKLYLNNYRDYPQKKEYEFGKVNLINGVNGSGKTSLLESLELLLCGESYRNPDENTSEFQIKALINNGQTSIEYSPDDISIYKKRDEYWYNNPYHRGSIKTHLNFKKYNFFNSDAAFELSSESHSYNIKKAFEDMALGETVNAIEKRLNGFYERFQRELKSYSKNIEQWQIDIKNEQEVIDEISDTDKNPEKFFKEFKKECKDIGWKINETLGREKVLTYFQKNITSAEQLLKSINQDLSWIEKFNLRNIKELEASYSESVGRVKQVNKKLKQTALKLEELKEEESELFTKQKRLNKFKEYYALDNTEELIGIDEKIKDITREVDKYSKVEELLEQTTLEFLKNTSGKLNDYQEDVSEQIQILKDERKELRGKIKSVRKGVDLLEEIVSEIKSKGKQFVKHNSDTNECPLCHTKFEEGQLSERISRAHTEFKQSELLEDFIEDENDLNSRIKMLEDKRKNLSQIKELSFHIYGEDYTDVSIEELLGKLDQNSIMLKKAKSRLDKAKSLRQEFANNGLSEDEFQGLLEYFEDEDLADQEARNKMHSEIRDSLETKKREKSEHHKNRGELKDEKETILNNRVFEVDDQEEELFKRSRKLKTILKRLEDLEQYIEFEEDVNIDEIENRISKIYGLYQKTNELFNEKEQNKIKLKAANDKIEELENKISNASEIKERAKKATDSISYIFDNYSKSEYLNTFFKHNISDIADTFMMIHSPREFSGLDLTEDNGSTLTLVRSRNGKEVTLNEISSGQRSALALSIFLTLNKQLDNGPDVILFDDPLTTIDDLNILSFLDYLREIVLNKDKQVFFATANDDIANLFKKKFEFLGENSFKKFDLSRN